jgi:hypothetical protein
LQLFNLFQARIAGQNHAEGVEFAETPGDQTGELRTEIEDDNHEAQCTEGGWAKAKAFSEKPSGSSCCQSQLEKWNRLEDIPDLWVGGTRPEVH